LLKEFCKLKQQTPKDRNSAIEQCFLGLSDKKSTVHCAKKYHLCERL